MKKLVITTLLLLLFSLVGTSYVFGQKKETDPKDKKITIKMEKQPLGNIIKYLMKNYDILIGFESSNLDMEKVDYGFDTNLPNKAKIEYGVQNNRKYKITAYHYYRAPKNPITVVAENKPLKEVFDTIVKQMKYYDWEINESIVNIFPKKGRDLRFKELLETKISSFKFEKGQTIRQITTKIKELPEIKKFLDEHNFYFSGIRTGLVAILKTQYGKKIDVEMNFSNITFKELLNKITKIKRGGWAIKNHGFSEAVQKEYIDIDI